MLISQDDRLSFEKSKPGRRAVRLPASRFSKDARKSIPEGLLRQTSIGFPEMSESDIVRHFINLSRKNFSVDTHFYPLGSCTMKYNPKVNEWAARQEKFTALHPLQSDVTVQGMLRSIPSSAITFIVLICLLRRIVMSSLRAPRRPCFF